MPVLMYHDVVAEGAEDSSGFPGRDAARYKVTPERFEDHLRAIVDTLPALPASPALPALVITFDDGGASGLAAADALERHGLRGCFLVTTNCIGTRGFLDQPAMRELHGRGHAIGSHSCSHPLRMGHWPMSRLFDEWTHSREMISSIIGGATTIASVPGGDYAPAVAEAAAAAGFTLLFTSEPTNHVRAVAGLELRGRFTINRWTTARTARDLALGNWRPRAQQAVGWNARKITKRLAGERYLQLRKVLLRHGNDVRWGDRSEFVDTTITAEAGEHAES